MHLDVKINPQRKTNTLETKPRCNDLLVKEFCTGSFGYNTNSVYLDSVMQWLPLCALPFNPPTIVIRELAAFPGSRHKYKHIHPLKKNNIYNGFCTESKNKSFLAPNH